MQIDLALVEGGTGDLLDVEIVERKGVGHPDTICDHLAEALSLGLSRYYLSRFGRVLHYNVDKALLWGGRSRPDFGGGSILEPMEFFLAGRATTSFRGVEVPVEALAREAAERWLGANLPLLDPRRDVKTHCLVRAVSSDLAALFERRSKETGFLANDTSCGVGYAPLSRLEAIVYDVEQTLGALSMRGHPEIGRDIKVMGVRRGRRIRLTVACAFVGRFLGSIADYRAAKRLVADVARRVAADHGADASIDVNAADDPAAGSVYLTVTGTSAESGDDGQAGRGNRVNGLIAPFRPTTLESVAGKNAVTHIGKLYNLAAGLIAQRAVDELAGVAEAHCLLVSSIGRPIAEPQLASVRLRLHPGSSLVEQEAGVAAIVADELVRLASADEALAAGRLRIDGWPLRPGG